MEAKDDGESKAASASASASAAAAAAMAAGDGGYDCNICLELAQDPVVTMCGHLFCWPCLYRWLASRVGCKECPVCKSAVESSRVVPIYGRGKGSTDPRTRPVPGVEIPNRPAGRRTEIPRDHQPQHQQPTGFHHHFGFSVFPAAATAHFGNVTLSAGFGIFPILFAFLSTWSPWAEWEMGAGGGAVPRAGAPPVASGGVAAAGGGGSGTAAAAGNDYVHQQEALLSRLLIFVGCFVILCLCFF